MQKVFQLHASVRLITICFIITLALAFSTRTVNAGDVLLTNNSGGGRSMWFISGERSLIINGFDLESRGVNLPVSVDQVSIEVVTAQPGGAVDVVVYGDANGGSPVDAQLLRSESINISSAGTYTYTFSTPVEVNTSVVWVGFYLPVDFEFYADTSGSSTSTYWAWTPGGEFDLSNLGSASVIGPADGSAPVSIDMEGIARITAEIITDGTTIVAIDPDTDDFETPISEPDSFLIPGEPEDEEPITQIVDNVNADLSIMDPYGGDCGLVFYDAGDINITYRQNVRWFCRSYPDSYAPEAPDGWAQRGRLFDVYVFGIESGSSRLPYPVTHCLAPQGDELNSAIVGLAYGSPREWHLLPTQRFAAVVCAELQYAGFISYFVPN